MGLNLIDKKLLYKLDQNCRTSLSQIGKELRIHRNVVIYRLKKLEENGVIKGYFSEIDLNQLGYIIFRIFIRLGNYNKEEEDRLLKHLRNTPQLMWLFQVQGKWDLDIVFAAQSISEFDIFLTELFSKFNKIIEDKTISIVSQIIHYPKDYLISKKREKIFTKEFAKRLQRIDEIDKKILLIISSKANIPFVDLAKNAGISINTLKERLKNLEKEKIILGYRPFIDTEKTGYQYYKIILFLRNYTPEDFSSLRYFFERNEKLVYITRYINGVDIEAEMHLENEKELLEVKDNLIEEFGDKIKEIVILKFYKEHIYRYLPKTL